MESFHANSRARVLVGETAKQAADVIVNVTNSTLTDEEGVSLKPS